MFRRTYLALILAVTCCFLPPVCLAQAQFLWLSDIHFNPFADPALVDKLAAAQPPDWASILATSSETKLSTYGQDTNWALFSSALAAIRQTLPQPSFLIVTGDLLAHNFRPSFNQWATVHDESAYLEFAHKTVEFVGLQLKQLGPNVRTFVALGNNDSDCGNYMLQPNGPFLHNTTSMISELAGLSDESSLAESWHALGSYVAPHPVLRNYRIISLNTVFLSPKYQNHCAPSNEDLGQNLLKWLAQELADARHRNQKVWLLYHIPPGIDGFATAHAVPDSPPVLLWKPRYQEKFIALLKRYRQTIELSFAGHTHVDDFRLIEHKKGERTVVMIEPALTPIYNQNPAFRVVSMDKRGRISDYATYYLTDLSSAGPAPAWKMEYRFDQAWGFHRVDASAFEKIWRQVGEPGRLHDQWVSLYAVEHAAAVVKPTNFRQLYCASGEIKASDYQACVARTISP